MLVAGWNTLYGRHPAKVGAGWSGGHRLKAQLNVQASRTKPLHFFRDIEPQLAQVEAEIRRALKAENPLLAEAGEHLLQGGGKRIRPALVLLAASFGPVPPQAAVPAAAAVEMIHMATLVHDDVVDHSVTRRGMPTINARWNEQVSVLMGDFLFASAFSVLAASGNPRVVAIMAEVVYQMCTGEIEQLTNSFNANRGEGEYLTQINKKTAYFIAECCRLGAVVSGAGEEVVTTLRDYGHGIGMGFQIIDDLLDLTARPDELGKPIGSDLREGILTLPIIYALRHSPRREQIEDMIGRTGLGDQDILVLREQLRQCNAFRYTRDVAAGFVNGALETLKYLPESAPREALASVAEFVLNRSF